MTLYQFSEMPNIQQMQLRDENEIYVLLPHNDMKYFVHQQHMYYVSILNYDSYYSGKNPS